MTAVTACWSSAITDYADLHARPERAGDELERRRAAVQGLSRPTRSSASTSRASIRDEDRRAGLPAAGAERSPHARAASSARAGGSARTAAASGPTWSSTRSATPDGELIGYAKITRDLTERAGAPSMALRRSEQQFRPAGPGRHRLRHLHAATATAASASWNAGRRTHQGLPARGDHRPSTSRFYTEEDRRRGPARAGRWRRPRAKAASRGRAGGSARTAAGSGPTWSSTPSATTTARLIGFAKITRDITERRRRSRRWTQAREALFQSQKMDAIGQLTGGVAHDFNNLLMAVLGQPGAGAQAPALRSRRTPLLDNAIQGAERGATLTQRMLAFARKQELKVGAGRTARPGRTASAEPASNASSASASRIETRFAPGPAAGAVPIPASWRPRCSTWWSMRATPCPRAVVITISARRRRDGIRQRGCWNQAAMCA